MRERLRDCREENARARICRRSIAWATAMWRWRVRSGLAGARKPAANLTTYAPPPSLDPMRARLLSSALFGVLIASATPALAGSVFLNGVNIDGVRNQVYDNAK